MEWETTAVETKDPFQILHIDVWENILTHLNVKEVKEFSLVSSDWKSMIATSPACNKRISLFIDNTENEWTKMTDEERETIVSSRGYNFVTILEASELSDSLPKLMSLQRAWKVVNIAGTEFSSTSKFIEFIRAIQNTVEKLTMSDVTIKENEQVEIVFKFPKLKTLHIVSSDDIAYHCDCPAVKSLEIIDARSTKKGTITKMLMTMKSLKKLRFQRSWGQWFDVFFEDEFDVDFPFQLENLAIFSSTEEIDNPIDEPFKKFLKAQTNSITKLEFSDRLQTNREIWRLIFQIKSLRTLITMYPPRDLDNELYLPKNHSLETLDLKHAVFHNKDQMLDILKASPNIKKLRVQGMNVEIGHFIQTKLLKLQFVILLQTVCTCGIMEASMPSFKFKKYRRITRMARKGKK